MEVLRYCRKCKGRRYFVDAYELDYARGVNVERWYCTECNHKLERNPRVGPE